ncbi:MAG: WHG domain-containing protein [Actinomycetota bacterium]|nr:WHG domain-containing protein [Actinomycetota bacterium]
MDASARPDDQVLELVKSTARTHLAEVGAHGLTLDAVASGSGLTIAEVEAHFGHRDELLTALLIDAYNASGGELERAELGAREKSPGARLLAGARGLRSWSIANPAEFALLYGSPVPGYDAPADTVGPASRTPAVLAAVLRSALEEGSLTPPARAIPGPPLIRDEAVALFGGLPGEPFPDLIERGIVLWSNLIGLLIFEVFSRTHDSVRDQAAFFDYAIAVAAENVGLVVPLDGDQK